LLAEGRSLEAIDLLSGLSTRNVAAHRLLAEAYMKADDPQSAAHAIAPILNLRKVPSGALRTAATVYMALGDDSQVRIVASRLRGTTGGKAKALAEVELFLGGLYESHQRYAPALRAYEDSNRALESRRALQAIARVAETLGNRERALLTYRRLCRLGGGKGADCAAAEELAEPPEAWP
jgi:tetratricopeptide (TPR) repeat protein